MDRQVEINKISNPGTWPRWPLLPLKRMHGLDTQLGCIADNGAAKRVVILTNMYSYDPNSPKIEYDSVEELVDDGWIVD